MTTTLKNNILCLSIEEPGQVYKQARFDRTGNISQITFDNKFSFCSSEKLADRDLTRHGQGLYNEFGITKPVGYAECGVGEKFPKIGVGLLTRKNDGPYDFLQSYEIDPFKIQTEKGEDRVTYVVLPEDCRGYSVKLTKKIRLSGNSFTIDYVLENTGTRKIITHEYCHNFIAINGSNIDKSYTLTLPCKTQPPSSMIEAVNPEHAVFLKSRRVNFNFMPERDFFFSPLAEFHAKKGEWSITHNRFGVGVKEKTDFVPEIMNLWGTKHVLSPELFIQIDLEPGQKQNWRRSYEFFYL